MTHYQTLGLARDATPAEIKRAYRRLAREHHPDMHPNDASAPERFRTIDEAYQVLSDVDQRRRYDRGEQVGIGASAARDAACQVIHSTVFDVLRQRVPRE
jgi:molecular chaperone DnaJ